MEEVQHPDKLVTAEESKGKRVILQSVRLQHIVD